MLLVCVVYVAVYMFDNPGPIVRNGFHWIGDQPSKVILFDKTTGQLVAEVETDSLFTTH